MLLGACAGQRPLSEVVGSIGQEYGRLQDEALLRNILRRSAGLPAHFTALTTIRGRSRIDAGANINLPLGGDAPSRFDFSPHVTARQGPDFELATQTNKEFYRGYLAPLGTATVHVYLRQDIPSELVLSLMIERIKIVNADGRIEVTTNTPDQEKNFAAFQSLLERLVDQGLTTERAESFEDVSPEITGSVGLDQVISAHQNGLRVEPVTSELSGKRAYRVRQISSATRFCFQAPREEPFLRGSCQNGPAAERFARTDGRFFGTTDSAVAVLDTRSHGRLEIYTRSLAEVLDYLGEIARMQLEGRSPPTIRTIAGRDAILLVQKASPEGDDAGSVAAEFAGATYTMPGQRSGGQSGAVLAIVSQLLAQAQSVKDLPLSNAVTIIGD